MISFFGFKEKTNFIMFCLYQEKNNFSIFLNNNLFFNDLTFILRYY